tara:strand:+ start:892 stop:1305 length:414 start_codon:yes stop_codon:yes gene_type:complete
MKINLVIIKNLNDFDYIRKLRNTSYVRLNSLNKKIISKIEHQNWLKKNKSNKFFILKKSKKNIGYIRIDKNNFVSWALEKNYWGKIKFSEHLKEATRDKKLKYSCIMIKENIKSQIAALKAGFKLNKIKDRKIFFKK